MVALKNKEIKLIIKSIENTKKDFDKYERAYLNRTIEKLEKEFDRQVDWYYGKSNKR